jgi:hypothetical protein
VHEWNPDILAFSLKKYRQANPLQVPQRGPYGERYPLIGHLYVCLNISLFISPSESLVREPPPCSLTESPWNRDTASPEPLAYLFIYLFIHSFMYVCRSPQKGALLHMGKNIRSPSTEPHADGRPTYNGVRPGPPRGMLLGYSYTTFRRNEEPLNS